MPPKKEKKEGGEKVVPEEAAGPGSDHLTATQYIILSECAPWTLLAASDYGVWLQQGWWTCMPGLTRAAGVGGGSATRLGNMETAP